MGMNTILTLIVGIVMTTMVGTQVAPSIIDQIKVKKTQTQTINNQEVIFEAIKRYTTMKQVAPTSITQLISANYIDAKVNDNGFGGTYTINVNKALGVATITTTIADPKAQEAFLNSFMGTSKPTRVGATNNFETKFVLPNEVMHGNALLMTGIPIQATPPDSNINKYWYDTKDGKATLKIYDNDSSSWIEVNLGGEANTQKFEPGDYELILYSGVLNGYPENSMETPRMLSEIIATRSGTLRFSFSLDQRQPMEKWVTICKNNIPVGTPRSPEYGIFETYVEDISFNLGDKLQLCYKNTDQLYKQSITVRNYKIMSSKETVHALVQLR